MIAFTVQKIKVSSGANAEKRDNENGSQNWGGRRKVVSHEKTFRDGTEWTIEPNGHESEGGAHVSSCLLCHVLRLEFVIINSPIFY